MLNPTTSQSSQEKGTDEGAAGESGYLTQGEGELTTSPGAEHNEGRSTVTPICKPFKEQLELRSKETKAQFLQSEEEEGEQICSQLDALNQQRLYYLEQFEKRVIFKLEEFEEYVDDQLKELGEYVDLISTQNTKDPALLEIQSNPN